MHWKAVIKFWLHDHEHKHRFAKSKRFDALIRGRFLETYREVVRGEHADWRTSARGRLAEIIVLDQFARNMFRAKGEAFAHDAMALALAQEAVRAGADRKVSKEERMFFYLPFMHAESRKLQRESLKLFKKLGNKEALWYAHDHKKVIDRFGRYPHRNEALGRKSSAAERKFMRIHKGY